MKIIEAGRVEEWRVCNDEENRLVEHAFLSL
jgi:hypothetical protein